MRFRAKIFLAIVLPSSALIAVAVVVAIAGITRDYEEKARDQLSRTREAFEGTLAEQLRQLQTLSAPFGGARFDAAITEAVASGDLAAVKQQLDYQFQLVGGTPEFYELRGKNGKVLLRKSFAGAGAPGPVQAWRDPEKALTEFDGQPFLAIRFEHENGTLIIGKLVTPSLERLKRQRIVAFGQMSGASTLDATAGRVRMEITRLTGTVVQLDPLVLNLVELGGLRPGAFDFRGTGTSAATNADPTQYAIETSTLSLVGVSSNDLVKVHGLVHPFGAAPAAFDARTVVDVDTDSVGAWFWAGWRQVGGTADPFVTVAQDLLDVDLTDARHTLNLLGIPRDALGDGDHIALSAPTDVRGIYMVTVRGANEVQLFRDFAALTPELSDQLAAGNRLVQINAIGRYNATSLALTTPRASFEFTAP